MPSGLRASIEQAAELGKKELTLKGSVGSMAVFVYPDSGPAVEGAEPTGLVKAVSLSTRSELQKEAVRKRIREKVAAETISTVVLVSDGKKDRNAGRTPNNATVVTGSIVITGVTPSANATASVTYSFDKGTRAFSVWELRWLDSAVDNYFLQGVFGQGESRSGNRHRRN
jgi:hypothetical protein